LNIGTIQENAKNMLEAQNYYSKALEGFEKAGDSLNIGRVLSSIGSSYSQLNNYKLANEYYERAMFIFQELNSPADIAASYYNLSLGEKMSGFYSKALEYLEISLQNIAKIDYTFAGPRLKLITQVEVEFGEVYLLLGNLTTAKQHLLKGYVLANENGFLSDSKSAAKNLSLLYEQLNQYDSALFYHKIFKEKSVQLINVENIKKLANIDAQNKYEQLIKEEEIRRKEDKVAQRRRNTIYIIAIIFLFLLAILLTLFLKLGRNKVATVELQKKNLQNKLELRNKELTTHVMTQLKKNELILEISEKLEKTLDAATPENKPVIERVIKELESENTKEVWKEFEIRFQNVHHDFYKKLVEQFPDLSSNELRLCAFIKLNLNTKEISSITHQSVNSIDVARSRLRHKLGLSKEENLTSFLTGF
jgi:tetratricopeptide (TPR) repeat protein